MTARTPSGLESGEKGSARASLRPTPKSADTEAEPAGAFTPGPWFAVESQDDTRHDIRALSSIHPLATVSSYWTAPEGGVPDRATREANARLIAAATDLLRQCQEARDFLSATHQNLTNGEWDDYGAMMLDADMARVVAKALGREAASPADV